MASSRKKAEKKSSKRWWWTGILAVITLAFLVKPVHNWYSESRLTTPFIEIREGQPEPKEPLPRELLCTAEYLGQFSSHSCLDVPIRDIVKQLSVYNDTLASAWEQAKGLEIDVILQEHHSADGAISPMVERSQRAIEHILDWGRYSVVAMEGNDLSEITEEGLFHLQRAFVDARGIRVGDVEVRNMVSWYIETNGVTRYARSHPDVHIFGCEMRSLLDAHACFVTGMGYRPGQDSLLDNLAMVLSFSRSQMALAKTILELRASGQKRAAIVIGALHGPEIEAMLRKLKIRSDMYLTTRVEDVH
jgi:hypothetical protein